MYSSTWLYESINKKYWFTPRHIERRKSALNKADKACNEFFLSVFLSFEHVVAKGKTGHCNCWDKKSNLGRWINAIKAKGIQGKFACVHSHVSTAGSERGDYLANTAAQNNITDFCQERSVNQIKTRIWYEKIGNENSGRLHDLAVTSVKCYIMRERTKQRAGSELVW